MSQKWTPERINQLLLLVIRRHYTGTPDYKYLAEQLGVTKNAVKIKFDVLRRQVETTPEISLPPTPNSSLKRKAKQLQETPVKYNGKKVKIEGDIGIKVEAEDEESGSDCERVVVKKRARTGRAAAAEAREKIKEDYSMWKGMMK